MTPLPSGPPERAGEALANVVSPGTTSVITTPVATSLAEARLVTMMVYVKASPASTTAALADLVSVRFGELWTCVVSVSESPTPSALVTQAVLLRVVPLGSGESTSTVKVMTTEPPGTMFEPSVQVMTSLASGPSNVRPLRVVATNVVLAGTTSVITTPVAGPLAAASLATVMV